MRLLVMPRIICDVSTAVSLSHTTIFLCSNDLLYQICPWNPGPTSNVSKVEAIVSFYL